MFNFIHYWYRRSKKFKHYREYRFYLKYRLYQKHSEVETSDVPDIRPFFISGIRPDTGYALSDIRPDIRYPARPNIRPDIMPDL